MSDSERSNELCRHSANGAGEAQPVVEVGEGFRQMQHDASYGAFDRRAEFEQPFQQYPYLGAGTLATASTDAQLLHQHVIGRGQQDAQLVRSISRP